MDIKNGGQLSYCNVILWMFLSEMPCLAPSRFQASLASTASIWAATGRWVPRDHCTSLDPFFNEGAMRPSDPWDQIQGLGSIGTEVYWSCTSMHFQDSSWSLSPSHSWHTWFKNPFLHVFVRSVFAYLTKTQQFGSQVTANMPPSSCQLLIFGETYIYIYNKYIYIYIYNIRIGAQCQVLIFDIDSPACDGAPPAPRIVLLPQSMWTEKDIAKEWRERGTCQQTSYRNLCKLNVWRICRILRSDYGNMTKNGWQVHFLEWSLAVPGTSSCITAVPGTLNFFMPLTSRDHGWYCWSTLAAPSLKCNSEVKSHLVLRRFASRSKGGMGGDSVHENVSIYIYIYISISCNASKVIKFLQLCDKGLPVHRKLQQLSQVSSNPGPLETIWSKDSKDICPKWFVQSCVTLSTKETSMQIDFWKTKVAEGQWCVTTVSGVVCS